MYNKLKKIQLLLWKNEDNMDQNTLFEVQEHVAMLLLEVAKKEKKTDDLVKTFPWIYKTE